MSNLQEYREELGKKIKEMKAREREKEEGRGKLEKKIQELREGGKRLGGAIRLLRDKNEQLAGNLEKKKEQKEELSGKNKTAAHLQRKGEELKNPLQQEDGGKEEGNRAGKRGGEESATTGDGKEGESISAEGTAGESHKQTEDARSRDIGNRRGLGPEKKHRRK